MFGPRQYLGMESRARLSAATLDPLESEGVIRPATRNFRLPAGTMMVWTEGALKTDDSI